MKVRIFLYMAYAYSPPSSKKIRQHTALRRRQYAQLRSLLNSSSNLAQIVRMCRRMCQETCVSVWMHFRRSDFPKLCKCGSASYVRSAATTPLQQ